MYKYETHLHTAPISKCASATVKETLEFYKKIGYDGVFITNHFIDGNMNVDRSMPYEEQIELYFSDVEEGMKLAEEIGIKVFSGIEMSYGGTDFLVYGLDKEWFLAHPEITGMKKSEELKLLRESGAFVIQAHPYREAVYIDHIRLFPRSVDGVEVINASCKDEVNKLASIYADCYGLLKSAGSDNHSAQRVKMLAGVCTDSPIESVEDFIEKIKAGETRVFHMPNPLM